METSNSKTRDLEKHFLEKFSSTQKPVLLVGFNQQQNSTETDKRKSRKLDIQSLGITTEMLVPPPLPPKPKKQQTNIANDMQKSPKAKIEDPDPSPLQKTKGESSNDPFASSSSTNNPKEKKKMNRKSIFGHMFGNAKKAAKIFAQFQAADAAEAPFKFSEKFSAENNEDLNQLSSTSSSSSIETEQQGDLPTSRLSSKAHKRHKHKSHNPEAAAEIRNKSNTNPRNQGLSSDEATESLLSEKSDKSDKKDPKRRNSDLGSTTNTNTNSKMKERKRKKFLNVQDENEEDDGNDDNEASFEDNTSMCEDGESDDDVFHSPNEHANAMPDGPLTDNCENQSERHKNTSARRRRRKNFEELKKDINTSSEPEKSENMQKPQENTIAVTASAQPSEEKHENQVDDVIEEQTNKNTTLKQKQTENQATEPASSGSNGEPNQLFTFGGGSSKKTKRNSFRQQQEFKIILRQEEEMLQKEKRELMIQLLEIEEQGRDFQKQQSDLIDNCNQAILKKKKQHKEMFSRQEEIWSLEKSKLEMELSYNLEEQKVLESTLEESKGNKNSPSASKGSVAFVANQKAIDELNQINLQKRKEFQEISDSIQKICKWGKTKTELTNRIHFFVKEIQEIVAQLQTMNDLRNGHSLQEMNNSKLKLKLAEKEQEKHLQNNQQSNQILLQQIVSPSPQFAMGQALPFTALEDSRNGSQTPLLSKIQQAQELPSSISMMQKLIIPSSSSSSSISQPGDQNSNNTHKKTTSTEHLSEKDATRVNSSSFEVRAKFIQKSSDLLKELFVDLDDLTTKRIAGHEELFDTSNQNSNANFKAEDKIIKRCEEQENLLMEHLKKNEVILFSNINATKIFPNPQQQQLALQEEERLKNLAENENFLLFLTGFGVKIIKNVSISSKEVSGIILTNISRSKNHKKQVSNMASPLTSPMVSPRMMNSNMQKNNAPSPDLKQKDTIFAPDNTINKYMLRMSLLHFKTIKQIFNQMNSYAKEIKERQENFEERHQELEKKINDLELEKFFKSSEELQLRYRLREEELRKNCLETTLKRVFLNKKPGQLVKYHW